MSNEEAIQQDLMIVEDVLLGKIDVAVLQGSILHYEMQSLIKVTFFCVQSRLNQEMTDEVEGLLAKVRRLSAEAFFGEDSVEKSHERGPPKCNPSNYRNMLAQMIQNSCIFLQLVSIHKYMTSQSYLIMPFLSSFLDVQLRRMSSVAGWSLCLMIDQSASEVADRFCGYMCYQLSSKSAEFHIARIAVIARTLTK